MSKNNIFSDFKAYPTINWVANWIFKFNPLNGEVTDVKDEKSFKTLNERGLISSENSELWKVHFNFPQKSNFYYTSNGFIAHQKIPLAVIASPAPNVLCGFVPTQFKITLTTKKTHSSDGKYINFQCEDGVGTFVKNEINEITHFCLVLNSASQDEAIKTANEYLNISPSSLIPFSDYRSKVSADFDLFHKSNNLPSISFELLMRQLRAPQGVFDSVWPESLGDQNFALNELLPLTVAWSDLDVERAKDFLDLALSLQRSDGHLPSWVSPTGGRNSIDAPYPFFAQCALIIANKSDDSAFIKKELPKLHSYMRWSLRHLFPQGTIHPMNQSAQESLSPENWQKNFASAECCALLLCELNALLELSEKAETVPPIFIQQSKESLENILTKDFWNPKTKSFSYCYLREEKLTQYGLHEFLPLLTDQLDLENRNALITQLKKSPWYKGFQSDPETGEATSPATTMQEFIVLQCLKQKETPKFQTTSYVTSKWSTFSKWSSKHFKSRNAIEMPEFDTAFVALLMDLKNQQIELLNESKPLVRKSRKLINKLQITRDDVIIVVVGLILMFATRTIYQSKYINEQHVNIQDARSFYAQGNAKEAFRACTILLHKHPDNIEARQILANLYLIFDQFEESEENFEKLYKADPDNPSFIIGLALSRHRQGKTQEANELYEEFQLYFSDYFPEIGEIISEIQTENPQIVSPYYIEKILTKNFMLLN